MSNTNGEGPAMTIVNDPEILAKAGGQIDYSEGPPLKRARTKLRRGSYDSMPVDPVHNAAVDPVTPQPAPPRPGTYDTASPDRLGEKVLAAQAGTVRVRVGVRHDARARRMVPIYEVLSPAPGSQVRPGTAFEGGIPLEAFGVPVAPGMQFDVTATAVK